MALTRIQAAGVLQEINKDFELEEKEREALEIAARALLKDPDEIKKAIEDFKAEIRKALAKYYKDNPKECGIFWQGKTEAFAEIMIMLEEKWAE